MREPMIDQALVRLIGNVPFIPDGFERPVEDQPSLFVHEIPFAPIGLSAGLDLIARELETMSKVLRQPEIVANCRAVLHLQVSVGDEDYLVQNYPRSFLRILVDIGLELELVEYGC